MDGGQVKILDGNTFVVSDERGDIEASLTDPTGLFSFDTRFLSTWVLTVGGQRLSPLSVDDLQYFQTRFFLVPGTGTVYVDSKLSVIRHRTVGNGFHEELTILNHDDAPVHLTIVIEADSDFADLFEVKDALQKKGTYDSGRGGRAALAYQRETFRRATAITSSQPCEIDERGLTFEDHDRRRTATGRPTIDVFADLGGTAERGGSRALAWRTPSEHGGRPRTLARRRAAARVRLGAAHDRPTSAASSTSPRCASHRCPPGATRSRPPGCRGS